MSEEMDRKIFHIGGSWIVENLSDEADIKVHYKKGNFDLWVNGEIYELNHEELDKLRELLNECAGEEGNELKLFKKTKEFEKRITKLEKELKTKEKRLKEANDFIRKYIPAFPSSNNQINLEYAKELIEKELNKNKNKNE